MPNSKSCHPLIIWPSFLLFFAMLVPPAPAQEKTTFYYPLNDGNVWEYEEGPFPFPIRMTLTVVKDTLLPNGKTYKIIRRDHEVHGPVNIYQRIENNMLYEYWPRFVPPDSIIPDEALIYKLDVAVGDMWVSRNIERVGILADSGFYRVEEIDSMSFSNRSWRSFILGIYTLPDSSLVSSNAVAFLDSLGILGEGFKGGAFVLQGAIIEGQRYGTLTSVDEPRAAPPTIPTSIALFVARPNPAISSTKLHFTLNSPDVIRITIFDILGRQVYAFPQQPFGAGSHVVRWDGAHQLSHTAAATGLYFAVIAGGRGGRVTRKFLLVR